MKENLSAETWTAAFDTTVTWVKTATPKKVAVAARDRKENRDRPQRKCPEVHPLPSCCGSYEETEWSATRPLEDVNASRFKALESG